MLSNSITSVHDLLRDKLEDNFTVTENKIIKINEQLKQHQKAAHDG